jgi:hypothetical protein
VTTEGADRGSQLQATVHALAWQLCGWLAMWIYMGAIISVLCPLLRAEASHVADNDILYLGG